MKIDKSTLIRLQYDPDFYYQVENLNIEKIMGDLTPPMLMDENGYPNVMEIVSPMCVSTTIKRK